MGSTRIDRERYWAERRELARYHRQRIGQMQGRRRKGLPPKPAKRDWQEEKALFRAAFKKHLIDFALEFGLVIMKIAGLR